MGGATRVCSPCRTGQTRFACTRAALALCLTALRPTWHATDLVPTTPFRELVPRALSAALFYAHHLGGRVPLVVLSDQLAAEAARAAAGETGAWQDTDHQDQGDAVGSSMGVGGNDEDQVEDEEEAAARRALLGDYLQAARAAGVQILSAAEYFAVHWPPGSAVSELYDSLVAAKAAAAAEGGEGGGGAGAGGGGGGEACYPAHLSQQEVEDGLTSGELLRVRGRGARPWHLARVIGQQLETRSPGCMMEGIAERHAASHGVRELGPQRRLPRPRGISCVRAR